MRERRWIWKAGVYVPTTCTLCGGKCSEKNIGDICIKCIHSVPMYIPNRQMEKFLQMKGENND